MSRFCLLILSIFLLGCHPPVPNSSAQAPNPTGTAAPPEPAVVSPSEAPVDRNLGQTLPISAKAIIAGKVIELEVASSPEQQAMGLMYRRSLADNRGMMFTFDPPQPVSFWMKNTLIPLDIIFLEGGKVKAISADVPPCKSDPCPTYGPNVAVDRVIELRGGRAAELGLKPGDRVSIEFLKVN
jgi:uncharacterized membrane protein (UPF0127 family)